METCPICVFGQHPHLLAISLGKHLWHELVLRYTEAIEATRKTRVQFTINFLGPVLRMYV